MTPADALNALVERLDNSGYLAYYIDDLIRARIDEAFEQFRQEFTRLLEVGL